MADSTTTKMDDKKPRENEIRRTTSVERGYAQSHINQKTLKRYTMKCDLIIIPMVSFSYLLDSLDRSNLGNAETAGLSKDLGLHKNQYNLCLTVYYIAMLLFGPVGTLVSKKFSGKYGIPLMLLGFGCASICTAAVKSFSGLIACRFFVGVFESGFVASSVVYFSTFYTSRQIAFRIGIFYASSITASAFGGLLAYGVFHLRATNNLFTWSYLFFLEGGITLITAVAAFFILPYSIETAYFLNQDEKDAGKACQLLDSVNSDGPSHINWEEAVSEFKSWHFPLRAIIGFTYGVLLNSNANFLAIMTQRLGYGVVKTNLFTVAPAITSACTLLVISFSSDYFQERGFHMILALGTSLVGYILLIVVDMSTQKGLAYFAIFLCTIGAYPISVLYSAWMLSNINSMNARAATMGVLLSLTNSSGFLASNIFITGEAPRYISALKTNCVCASICMLLCGSYSAWMRLENRRRGAKVQSNGTSSGGIISMGAEPHSVGFGFADPNFRFKP